MGSGCRLALWINLFGRERRGTADDLVNPVRDRVFEELNRSEKLRSAGRSLNDALDKINNNQEAKDDSEKDS